MSRFYISDGARPGRRSPVLDYATRVNGVGSDILNEAQAIARGRKLTPTMGSLAPMRIEHDPGVTYRSSGNYNGDYDLVNGRPAEEGSYPATLAFDDIQGPVDANNWLSARVGQSVPHWIGVDFGVARSVTGYVLKTRTDSYANLVPPRKWIVQGSNDGWAGTWTDIDTRTSSSYDWAANGSVYSNLNALSGSYRYLRFYFPANAASGGFDCISMSEIEVWGVPLTAAPPSYSWYRFTFSGTPKAQFGYIPGQSGIGAHGSQNGGGSNLFDTGFMSDAFGAGWTNVPAGLFRDTHGALAPYSYTPSWISVRLTAPVSARSFHMVEYTAEGGVWRYTPGAVLIEGSLDGSAWSTIKNANGADFVLAGTTSNSSRYYINV